MRGAYALKINSMVRNRTRSTMRPRTSHYPIGKLLLKTLEASGLSLHYFSLAIGYGNSNKGVRAFDQMLTWGVPNPVFLMRLQSSRYAIPAETLTEALVESETIVAEETRLARIAWIEEERRRFVPFIQAIPEHTMPTSITFHALTGGLNRYTHYLPSDFPEWSVTEQHRHLLTLIPNRFAAANGRTLFMGAITGYRLCIRYGEPAGIFSVDGTPLEGEATKKVGEATVRLAGKPTPEGDLTGIFVPTESDE